MISFIKAIYLYFYEKFISGEKKEEKQLISWNSQDLFCVE